MSPSNRPHRTRVFQLVIGIAVLVAASIAAATSWPVKEPEVSTVGREPAGLSEQEIASRREAKMLEIAAKAAPLSRDAGAALGESGSAAPLKTGSGSAAAAGATPPASAETEVARVVPVDTTPRKLPEMRTIEIGPEGLSDMERAKAAAAASAR